MLLIDEVDRADDEFEALLLEALGEGSVTVPELGTFTAVRPPIVVLTSNRSRDLHDALRRRCLYHWLDYPDLARVVAILRRSAPSANLALIESAAQFVGHVRSQDLDKPPGVAEAINWVAALSVLGATELVKEMAVPDPGRAREDPRRPRPGARVARDLRVRLRRTWTARARHRCSAASTGRPWSPRSPAGCAPGGGAGDACAG